MGQGPIAYSQEILSGNYILDAQGFKRTLSEMEACHRRTYSALTGAAISH